MRRELLEALDVPSDRRASLASELLHHPEDNRMKLFATTTMLRARRAAHDVFRCGSYEPLTVEGSARQHLFAFGRVLGDRHLLVGVPRLVATLSRDGHPPIGDLWGDTRLSVPGQAPRCYRQIFTGACATVIEQDGRKWIRAAEVFEQFPIAFLEAA
jgi:(1->4)-alpha-D-glucan 1-alpha-D-glucosylmutase